MSGHDDVPELLAQGPERERTALLPRLSRPGWTRRWWALPLIGLVLLAGAGAAAAITYVRNAPRLPTLSVEADPRATADAANPGSGVGPWTPGPDGRPVAGVHLVLNAILTVPTPQARHGRVTVLGLTGPGVRAGAPGPIPMTVGQPTRVVLSADVDCTQVDLPVAASAYGLQVREDEGSRSIEGLLPLGTQSAEWDSKLDLACGSWLARRDLTVTAISAVPDPLQPATDLRLTITNAAKQSAYLVQGDFYGAIYTVTGPAIDKIHVPGGGQAVVPLHLALDSCHGSPNGPTVEVQGVHTTVDDFGFYASIGRPALSTNDPVGSDPAILFDGYGPTGLVMNQQAETDLTTALRSACGGLDLVVTRPATRGRAIDPATHVMTLRVGIQITSGTALDLRLVSDSFEGAAPTDYVPLWTTSPKLVPDSRGLAVFVLRYRVPTGANACANGGQSIPGFTVFAHVAAPGGVKTVRYQEYLPQPQDPTCSR